MELIFMQFLCTWQYGSFYTPQRVDTSKALHSATLPWAECKTSLQKRMVVLVCLPKALDNQPRSVSHPQHPMARCRRYPEFRRKRKNRVYESNIYKYNIYIYIYVCIYCECAIVTVSCGRSSIGIAFTKRGFFTSQLGLRVSLWRERIVVVGVEPYFYLARGRRSFACVGWHLLLAQDPWQWSHLGEKSALISADAVGWISRWILAVFSHCDILISITIYIYIYTYAHPPKIHFLHPFVCPKFCQKAFCTIKNKNRKTEKNWKKNENKQKKQKGTKKKNKRLWGNSGWDSSLGVLFFFFAFFVFSVFFGLRLPRKYFWKNTFHCRPLISTISLRKRRFPKYFRQLF